MTYAARRAAESLLQELESKIERIPCAPIERAEIRGSLVVGIGTLNQRRALEYALTDQGRALDRDAKGYLENVQDSLGVVIGHTQLVGEISRAVSLK